MFGKRVWNDEQSLARGGCLAGTTLLLQTHTKKHIFSVTPEVVAGDSPTVGPSLLRADSSTVPFVLHTSKRAT